MRSAAAGALFALALGTAAQAAPVKHHRHYAASTSAQTQINAELVAQVNALTARVNELTARLDAQAASQQQTVQVAQSAQAQAAQAEADIKRIPAEVHTEVAKATPKPGWWGNTSISGRMYYNLSSITQKTNTGVPASSGNVPPTGYGFDIKRFYVGIDHKFNDTFSANLTTDMQYSSGVSATEFFIKKAYLQARVSDGLTFRFGSADMPWVPFVEDVYGYRYVEQTIIDRDKFGTSADWGVHMLGKFDDGHLGYQVSVVNGAGYKKPGMPGSDVGVRSKRMDVEARVNANFGPLVFALGGYDGYLGKNVQVAPGGAPLVLHEATRFNALAAYKSSMGALGVEYFDTHNWAVTSIDKANGTSVFGNWNFMPKMAVFGRYDWETPNATTAPSKRQNYYNIGISYEPTKIVDFSLLYKRDRVEHGTLATGLSATAIGGAVSGTYDEFGLFGQVRW
jgi:hypothetical protein